MRRHAFRRSTLTLLLALLFAAGRAEALSYISIEAGRILLWNPGGPGEVSPVLLSTAGAAVPLIDIGPFRFELGALFWGTQYQYLADSGSLVPTQLETASQIAVLGVWVAPLAGLHFVVAGGKLELGAAAGPSLNFRFALTQSDVATGAKPTLIGPAYTYFFAGRFLFPETRLWLRWYVFDDFALSLSATALFPMFHIWDHGAFLDQFTVAVIAGFDIRLPQRTSPAAPKVETAPAQGASP